MQNEPAPTPEATRLLIRILVGIIQGTIREKGGIFHYANVNEARGDLSASVIKTALRCFNRRTASPRLAADAIARRNLQDLAPEERELVFRTIVLDVPGFLTWCFPLITGFSLIVRQRGFVAGREQLRLWVRERFPRWLITHVLLHRHRDPHEPRMGAADFSPDPPLTGIAATLNEFGVLDAWLDDAAMKTDAEALYLEFARRTNPFGRHRHRADWMLGIVDRPGSPSARHRLVLHATEVMRLWGAVRFDPNTLHTGRIEHARARLGVAFIEDLAEAGYLEAVGDDYNTVVVNRDKLRRTTIVLAETTEWKPPMPRVQDVATGGLETPRRERSWVEVIERAGVKAATLDRRRQARTADRDATAPKLAAPLPRLSELMTLSTTLHLTIEESTALLALAAGGAHGARVDCSALGESLVRHLSMAGYLLFVRGTPAGALIGTIDHGRLERTAIIVTHAAEDTFVNRLAPLENGQQTDRSWIVRLQRAVDRAAMAQEDPSNALYAKHRFRIHRAEADALLRLVALSPFTIEEIERCHDQAFREALRAFGYLKEYGVFPYMFKATLFEGVPDDVALPNGRRHEDIPEADRVSIPTTRWLEDIRAIARGA